MALKIHSAPSLVQSVSTRLAASGKLSINDLSLEIWEHIANYLSLKEIALTEHLVQHVWQHLKRNDGYLDLSDLDTGLFKILKQYKDRKIVSLNLVGCRRLRSAVVAIALRNRTSLTALYLGRSTYASIAELSHLSLNTLSLNAPKYDCITDSTILPSISKMPLMNLFLKARITKFSIDLLSKLPSLKTLKLSIEESPAKKDDMLAALSKLPLTGLNLNTSPLITDEGLFSISNLPLKAFGIYANEMITNKGLEAICQPPLTRLNLSLCNGLFLTPTGFKVLSKLSLTHLHLEGCNITDEFLYDLQPTIISLNLARTKITDLALEIISKFALYSLNLFECANISDKGVRFITQKSLRYLNLAKCENLTEKSLVHISKLSLIKCDVSNWGSPESKLPFSLRLKHSLSNLFRS